MAPLLTLDQRMEPYNLVCEADQVPAGWPASDHFEPDAEVRAVKLASGLYREPKAAEARAFAEEAQERAQRIRERYPQLYPADAEAAAGEADAAADGGEEDAPEGE